VNRIAPAFTIKKMVRMCFFFAIGFAFLVGVHNYYSNAKMEASMQARSAIVKNTNVKNVNVGRINVKNANRSLNQPDIDVSVNSQPELPTAQKVQADISPNISPKESPVSAQDNPKQEISKQKSVKQESIARQTTRQNSIPKPNQISITKYGHFPYRESSNESLVDSGNGQLLHHEAATAAKKMMQAARKNGVYIVPVSGYRDLTLQEELFAAQIQRRGSIQMAATVSAPPGYSEHHTGYALDFGDQNRPETDTESTFEQTDAFQWLAQNAHQYGFEMSFPPGNSQGVMYEPWHWRYVASSQSQQIFYQARQNGILLNSKN
jgi:zinc D-Ala-D-Ala carboxypeptidase